MCVCVCVSVCSYARKSFELIILQAFKAIVKVMYYKNRDYFHQVTLFY